MKSVILTNEQGESLGSCDLLEAHTAGGKLHKAFSIFVFNADKTKLLIQKRADKKLLFGGFWANTCCSHPRGESTIEDEAAVRLQEECGFTCPLIVFGSFVYKADDPSGSGTEHEYDTILIGQVDEEIALNPDPDEIAELQWMEIKALQEDMKRDPDAYAPWFGIGLELLGY